MAQRFFALTVVLACLGVSSALAAESAPIPASAMFRSLAADEIITPDELNAEIRAKGDKLVVFDARNAKSFDEAHIAGARLPFKRDYYQSQELYKMGVIPKLPPVKASLMDGVSDIPLDQPIVAYCGRGCNASAYLMLQLKDLGYTNVRVMEEGIEGWREKGYSIAS